VADAGFTAPEQSLRVVGTLAVHRETLFLEAPGAVSSFALSGGEKAAELLAREDRIGLRIRVTGRYEPGSEERPASLSIEQWALVPRSAPP